MKKILQILIVPKDGRVSDKTLIYNIVAGVIGILLCLTSLTAATWAWFGSSVTAQNNSIKAGQYNVSVSVVENGVTETRATLSANANNIYILEAGRTYRVTLAGHGNASTGYCSVKLTGCSDTVHTQQIYTPEYADAQAGKVAEVSFELYISEELTEGVELSVIPCWGSSALPAESRLKNGCRYSYNGAVISELLQNSVENNDANALE